MEYVASVGLGLGNRGLGAAASGKSDTVSWERGELIENISLSPFLRDGRFLGRMAREDKLLERSGRR